MKCYYCKGKGSLHCSFGEECWYQFSLINWIKSKFKRSK